MYFLQSFGVLDVQNVTGENKVESIKCYQMWMGKQNKNLALVLTLFLGLVALGVTKSKVRAAWIFQLGLLQALNWRAEV